MEEENGNVGGLGVNSYSGAWNCETFPPRAVDHCTKNSSRVKHSRVCLKLNLTSYFDGYLELTTRETEKKRPE